jgi:hypothetical protein
MNKPPSHFFLWPDPTGSLVLPHLTDLCRTNYDMACDFQVCRIMPLITSSIRMQEESSWEDQCKSPNHGSLSNLINNSSIFDSRWNRDFRRSTNCPTGQIRGRFPYTPPYGCMRYGLRVANMQWYETWPVVYHGTKYQHVPSIVQNPLKVGPNNGYGLGIYCSPNLSVAEQYCDVVSVWTGTRTARFKYIFMCRVNPNSIHYCTGSEKCPYATDHQFTLHIPANGDIWFANYNNQNYDTIRQYGLLDKEV